MSEWAQLEELAKRPNISVEAMVQLALKESIPALVEQDRRLYEHETP